MANIQIGSNYGGEVYKTILTKLVTSNDVMENRLARIVGGVKDTYNIPQLDVNNLIQDYSANPTLDFEDTKITLSDSKIELKNYQVFFPFLPRDFESYWKEFQPDGSLNFRELPSDVQATFAAELIKNVQSYHGDALLNGDVAGAAPLNKFDGLVTISEASTDVNKIEKTGAITESNVVSYLKEIKSAYLSGEKDMKAAYTHPDFKILVSKNVQEMYGDSQRSKTSKGISDVDKSPNSFHGKQIVSLYNMPDDTIIAGIFADTDISNMWVAFDDTMQDSNIVIDRLNNYGDYWFFKMNLKAGVGLTRAKQMVKLTATA